MQKRRRVTIAVPNRDDFKCEMVISLMMMITQTNALVNLTMPQTCLVDDARNMCWDDAKAFDSDWLLFMDTDNSVSCNFNVFEHMIAQDRDILSGVYVMRTPPYRPLVYDFTENGLIKNRTIIPDEPFPADACGGGLLLISRRVMDAFTPEVIEKYGKPFDFLNYGKPNMLREDVAFCWRIKQLGFQLWFDPQITMGHVGKNTFTLDHFKTAKAFIEAPVSDAVATGIDGWMSDKEMEFLKEKASQSETVVEIGSWKGRSTKVLLDSGAKVTAVDHWKGSDNIVDLAAQQDVYSQFIDNVGHYPNLEVMKMPSLTAAASLNGDKFDMIFIDADHTYEGCKSDIEAWLPRAKKIICGHDFQWSGVEKAVTEKFEKINLVDSIWWVDLEAVNG